MNDGSWSRRQLLGGLAGVGTAAGLGAELFPRLARAAQPTPGAAPRAGGAPAAAGAAPPLAIDVHHHILPPFYIEATMSRQLALAGPLSPASVAWTPERSVETMDQNGIGVSLISISTPGIWIDGGPASRVLARRCNEYAAKIVTDHSGRFGFMAALPLPDIDGSLEEIRYALDTLKADGIGLLTSYDNRWLGDPAFDRVFDELDRRAARIFVHPTATDCCVNTIKVIPAALYEFPFDTTRAIASLAYNGTLGRCQRLRFIFSHGGGTLPMIHTRLGAQATLPQFAGRMPAGFDGEVRRHYYDTASVTDRAAFEAVQRYLPLSQILFGTDYPYGSPVPGAVSNLAALGLADADLQRIRSGNARALFSRLAG